jgi:16S rRNA (guanine527-N7)-methyltransferase
VNEQEARAWLAQHHPRKLSLLQRYVDILLAANTSQNLISRASEPHIWARHIADSAQLSSFAAEAETWLDVGSGAGLPGIVLAIVMERPITLVEPRRKRVDFLRQVVTELALRNVIVEGSSIERLSAGPYGAVTARAYAGLPQIFSSTVRCTDLSTIWVLPKGRSAEQELAVACETWQGVFHVEQSLTDADARIVVATGVSPR